MVGDVTTPASYSNFSYYYSSAFFLSGAIHTLDFELYNHHSTGGYEVAAVVLPKLGAIHNLAGSDIVYLDL